MKQNNIDCFKCQNFYITWDNQRPYGCRAMGFKSKDIPSLVVLRSSGKDCLYFKKKEMQEK